MPRIPNLPQMGDDARSVRPADENASTPADQRGGDTRTPLSSGPNRGKNKEYRPATYALPDREVELKNGKIHVAKRVREDR